jgi:hypothetical protein
MAMENAFLSWWQSIQTGILFMIHILPPTVNIHAIIQELLSAGKAKCYSDKSSSY